jgi:hypothetical protein
MAEQQKWQPMSAFPPRWKTYSSKGSSGWGPQPLCTYVNYAIQIYVSEGLTYGYGDGDGNLNRVAVDAYLGGTAMSSLHQSAAVVSLFLDNGLSREDIPANRDALRMFAGMPPCETAPSEPVWTWMIGGKSFVPTNHASTGPPARAAWFVGGLPASSWHPDQDTAINRDNLRVLAGLAPRETEPLDPLALARGDRVVVHGLTSAAGQGLNGRRGRLGGALGAQKAGCVPVFFSKSEGFKQIKPCNLRLGEAANPEPPYEYTVE